MSDLEQEVRNLKKSAEPRETLIKKMQEDMRKMEEQLKRNSEALDRVSQLLMTVGSEKL